MRSPWMVSNIKSVLNTTWYGYLPAALEAQIIEKCLHIETDIAVGNVNGLHLRGHGGMIWQAVKSEREFEVYGASSGPQLKVGFSQNGKTCSIRFSRRELWRSRVKGIRVMVAIGAPVAPVRLWRQLCVLLHVYSSAGCVLRR